MASSSFAVQKSGASCVAALGVLLLPGLCVACGIRLVGPLLASETPPPSLHSTPPLLAGVGGFIMFAIAGYFLWATLRELKSAVGIRIDDAGIHTSRVPGGLLAWDQITALSPLSFGVVRVQSAQQSIRLATYLFDSRERLTRFLQKKTKHLKSS